MNLGVALGGFVGGLIASVAHPSTFTVLFLLDAVTFVGYAVVLGSLPVADAGEAERSAGAYARCSRDRPFMRLRRC